MAEHIDRELKIKRSGVQFPLLVMCISLQGQTSHIVLASTLPTNNEYLAERKIVSLSFYMHTCLIYALYASQEDETMKVHVRKPGNVNGRLNMNISLKP